MLTRLTRPVALAVLTASVIVGTVGVGGASPKHVAPAKWAKSVCTGVGTWLDQLTGHSPVIPTKDAVAAKAAFTAYLTDSITATDALVKSLKATGSPGVTNGPAMAKLLVSAFSDASASLGRAATTAAALPATDIATFNAAAAGFQTQIQGVITTAGAQLSTATKKYRSVKLDRAFAAEPSCQLGSTGSTTATTAAAGSAQPTCDAVSLLAAAKVKNAAASQVTGFQCGSGWAGAGVTLDLGSSGGVATAAIFKAQGSTWVQVDRTTQNCDDPTMPAAVHFYCTVS